MAWTFLNFLARSDTILYPPLLTTFLIKVFVAMTKGATTRGSKIAPRMRFPIYKQTADKNPSRNQFKNDTIF